MNSFFYFFCISSLILLSYFLANKDKLQAKESSYVTNINLQSNRKINTLSISNKQVLIEVLKGVGFQNEDAEKATAILESIFPLERLSNNSYLILPPIGSEISIFALNIDDIDAVVIKKKNKIFTAYLTKSNTAEKIVSKGFDSFNEIKKIIKLEKEKNQKKIKVTYEEIIFNRGNTLLGFLHKAENNKKKIKRAIKEIKKNIRPSSIKTGTEGLIIKHENNLIAFYIKVNKKFCILVYQIKEDFKSTKIEINQVKKFLNKEVFKNFEVETLKVTRISLFNSPNLEIKKNTFRKGQNFYELMNKYKIPSYEINILYSKLKPYLNLKKINVGQSIDVIFFKNQFYGISYEIDELKALQLVKSNNEYLVYIYEKIFKKKLELKNIVIKSNLYTDSKSEKLPSQIFINLVRLLSFSIDFQRDIQRETKFEILYEKFYDYNNILLKVGNILYSKVSLKKKNEIEMFYYEIEKGKGEYFNAEGKSIRKTLMRTPIDGARVSSGFGKRRHPILGYNKMHKGLDFAAKSGTPIYAAGDGVVERANYYGGYGRYIRIKHNSEYKTAYAHLSRFAKKLKKGNRVKQGSIIGYVGTSGRSTGPHLHYEVIYKNKQINPYKLNMPEVKSLNDQNMKEFVKTKDQIFNSLESLGN